MFDPETTAFLEGGCALIVGTVSADGEPHAGRGWGLDVIGPGPRPLVRVLLDAEDARTVEHVTAGGAVAITATSVRTLQSLQLKGRARGIDAPAPGDQARAERFMEGFFGDIQAMDGASHEILERFVPIGYVACLVEVHEHFDQTPGPTAGARVGGREP